jgi:hypothetical protein
MTLLLIPFAGLLLTGPTIWAAATTAHHYWGDGHHQAAHEHARELEAIDQWIHAIRDTP